MTNYNLQDQLETMVQTYEQRLTCNPFYTCVSTIETHFVYPFIPENANWKTQENPAYVHLPRL